MADLSDPPELIPVLAEKVRAGCDVVTGSRYMSGGTQQGGPLLKRSLSRAAGVSLAWLAGVGTHDATSNFRAYSKRFLDRTRIEASGGFEIALELTVKAHLAGGRVGEVPSSWTDRTAGQSRFRLWKWLPTYLRWYLLALREPLAAWAAVLFGLWWALGLYPGPAQEVARLLAWTSGAGAALALLWARAVRGRTRWLDAGQALIWFAPPNVRQPRGARAPARRPRSCWRAAWRAPPWSRPGRAPARPLDRSRARWRASTSGSSASPSWPRCWRSNAWTSWNASRAPSSTRRGTSRWAARCSRASVSASTCSSPTGHWATSWQPVRARPVLDQDRGLRDRAAAHVRGLRGGCDRARARRGRARAVRALRPPAMAGQDAWAFLVVASIGCWYFAKPERGVLHESLGTAVPVALALSSSAG